MPSSETPPSGAVTPEARPEGAASGRARRENDLPIVYCRGYAGPTSQIDTTVDDPFYGFNDGATHTRVNGDGDSRFYQFEGPMLRLMNEFGYVVPVRGSQTELLAAAAEGTVPQQSIWISRFYDAASTTFQPPTDESRPGFRGLLDHFERDLKGRVTSGFDIEEAARELYALVVAVVDKTGAGKVNLVAHSMGGLVARCMMQKICEEEGNRRAKDLVARLFTYATPHGGIEFTGGLLNWAMETFGPGGSDIFSPKKMYGYLTPGAVFGDLAPDGWDPHVIPPEIFDFDNIFCVIGTDQKDYGISKYGVGPESDGLVQIRNAYVKGAHRAFVYKSHSGRYGEVNSEEGYQNLARFLFGRWSAKVELIEMPQANGLDAEVAWQADVQLAIRGLSVLMTEQSAAHYCPVQLNVEAAKKADDSIESPVPLIGTFLLDRTLYPDLFPTTVTPTGDSPGPGTDPTGLALGEPGDPGPSATSRYALSLKVYQVATKPTTGAFDFTNNLEQMGDWADTLIVDVAPAPGGSMLVRTGWNSEIPGPINAVTTLPTALGLVADQSTMVGTPSRTTGRTMVGTIDLPSGAAALPIFGDAAQLRITIAERS